MVMYIVYTSELQKSMAIVALHCVLTWNDGIDFIPLIYVPSVLFYKLQFLTSPVAPHRLRGPLPHAYVNVSF